VKIITDAKYGRNPGAHLVGPEVTVAATELDAGANDGADATRESPGTSRAPTLSEVLIGSRPRASWQRSISNLDG